MKITAITRRELAEIAERCTAGKSKTYLDAEALLREINACRRVVDFSAPRRSTLQDAIEKGKKAIREGSVYVRTKKELASLFNLTRQALERWAKEGIFAFENIETKPPRRGYNVKKLLSILRKAEKMQQK